MLIITAEKERNTEIEILISWFNIVSAVFQLFKSGLKKILKFNTKLRDFYLGLKEKGFY